jgi:serine/threonine-protein kinase
MTASSARRSDSLRETGDSRVVLADPGQNIEREVASGDRERLAVVLRLGTFVYGGFSLALLPRWTGLVGPGAFYGTLAYLLGLSFMLSAGLLMHRDPERWERAAWTLGFVMPVFVLGTIGPIEGNLVSAFAHAAVTLIVGHALARPGRMRDRWRETLLVALAWPLAVASGIALSPVLREQVADPRLRADLIESILAILVAAVLALVGQDAAYTAQRSLLIAREARRYRPLALLGRGGMGEVFRASHPGLGFDVALKILRVSADYTSQSSEGPRSSEDDDNVQRFVREVRRTAELDHPGIVRVFDCGVNEEGHLYYTMELLTGGTLGSVVRRSVKITGDGLAPARAAYLLRDAARALAEAHQRGLVHRDVKPENLFVASVAGERDVMKVLDFGIARVLSEDQRLTGDGALIGTPAYMSLEQALGEPIDVRTDVYALGAVLYFALAGVPAIDEPSVFGVLAAHAGGSLLPLSVRRPDLPTSLCLVVDRAMHADKEQRYPDAGALADALDATGLPDAHRPGLSPDESKFSSEPYAIVTAPPDAETLVQKKAPRG